MDQELDELRREFLVEAQAKVREMQTALADSRGPEALERLAYLAHQLKGSGGSYGYQKISVDAAEIETAAELLSAGSSDPRVEAKIQQHVTDLRSEIDQRARDLGA